MGERVRAVGHQNRSEPEGASTRVETCGNARAHPMPPLESHACGDEKQATKHARRLFKTHRARKALFVDRPPSADERSVNIQRLSVVIPTGSGVPAPPRSATYAFAGGGGGGGGIGLLHLPLNVYACGTTVQAVSLRRKHRPDHCGAYL